MSGVRCHLKNYNKNSKKINKKKDKVVELVGGGTVINGATPVLFTSKILKTKKMG